MAWRARHRYARIADRKARLIADLIRGRECDEALEILRFTHNRAAGIFDRVLRSAMASANEDEAAMNRLFVAEARVDAGPIIKRWQPKDRGRAHPIQKKTSHLVVTVSEDGDGPSGTEVQAARVEAGMNVRDFARRFGRSASMWRAIESEQKQVPRALRHNVELFIKSQLRRQRRQG